MTSGDARDPLTSSGAIRKPGAVLVVDDDDALRLLVVRWLSKAGFVCVEARSGEEGLGRAQELADALDVIVCDVMMPGMNGFEVLDKLKENPATAQIPVVLLTAKGEEVDRIVGLEMGADDY
ncbi:MAG TPA: response regulator, partial [Polyangiaceae bacterium]